MRITANLAILDDLEGFNRSFFQERKSKDSGSGPVINWPNQKIREMKIEYKALLIDLNYHQKIAQSQLEIVSPVLLRHVLELTGITHYQRSIILWRNETVKTI